MRTALILFAAALFSYPAAAQPSCKGNDFDCQITENSKIVKADPSNRNAIFRLAFALDMKGRYSEALGMYDRYLSLPMGSRVDTASAYFNRGLIHQSSKSLQKAVDDFSRSIQLDPGVAKVYQNRGNSLLVLGKKADAVADLKMAVSLRPDVGEFHYSRGRAYHEMSEHNLALTDYDTAIRLDPTIAEAYYCRGHIFVNEKGRYAEAVRDFTKYLSMNGKDRELAAHAYYLRGWAQRELGDKNAALADMNKAIELLPNLASAFRMRASLYRSLNQTSQAAADEKRADELNKAGS